MNEIRGGGTVGMTFEAQVREALEEAAGAFGDPQTDALCAKLAPRVAAAIAGVAALVTEVPPSNSYATALRALRGPDA